MIRDASPFLSSKKNDGYVLLLEDEQGAWKTTNGEHVILMRGMIHGTLDEMKKQIDYVMQRRDALEGDRVVAVVDANASSFRYPDLLMRECFSHLRQYHRFIRKICLLNTPLYVRVGVRILKNFIDAETASMLHFATEKDIRFQGDRCLSEWTRERIQEYICWRCKEEDVSVAHLPPERAYCHSENKRCKSLLLKEYALLRHEVSKPPHLFSEKGWKCGSGKRMGTSAWKRKCISVQCDCVVYSDAERIVRIPNDDIRSAVVEENSPRVNLTTLSRDYLFSFENADLSAEFVRLVQYIINN